MNINILSIANIGIQYIDVYDFIDAIFLMSALRTPLKVIVFTSNYHRYFHNSKIRFHYLLFIIHLFIYSFIIHFLWFIFHYSLIIIHSFIHNYSSRHFRNVFHICSLEHFKVRNTFLWNTKHVCIHWNSLPKSGTQKWMFRLPKVLLTCVFGKFNIFHFDRILIV